MQKIIFENFVFAKISWIQSVKLPLHNIFLQITKRSS